MKMAFTDNENFLKVPFKYIIIVFVLFSLAILTDLYVIYFSSSMIQELGKYIELLIFLTGFWFFALTIRLNRKEHQIRVHHAQEIQKIIHERDALVKSSQEAIKSFESVLEIHFSVWKLTEAEKSVAMHLLKGMGSKEISEVRNVSEKTIKNQFHSIYTKSGLAGKHDLAAYFLKELLDGPPK